MDENEFQDVDDSFGSESTPSQPRRRELDGVPWAGVLLAIWAVALVIFSVQNAEDATVEFLGWSFSMPVALLVIVTALVTLVVSGIGSGIYRRRRRKQARLKREHREQLESDE